MKMIFNNAEICEILKEFAEKAYGIPGGSVKDMWLANTDSPGLVKSTVCIIEFKTAAARPTGAYSYRDLTPPQEK